MRAGFPVNGVVCRLGSSIIKTASMRSRDERWLDPVWRAKKSHFQQSVEMGMKTVDKNIDKRNKQRFGYENAS